MLRRTSRFLCLFVLLTLLCSIITGCTFNVESNIGKTALEYNTDYLADLMDITPENAEKVSKVLDEQGCGKLVTNVSKIVNGEGTYKVGDLKNKYVFVVEGSVLSRLETEDGELLRDLSNLANEYNETETSSETPTPSNEVSKPSRQEDQVSSLDDLFEENKTQPTDSASSLDELFEDNTSSESEGTYSFAWSDLTQLDKGVVESSPNGGLSDNTVLYNLGGYSLKDLLTMMVEINPDFNTSLFKDIYASIVLEEGWVARETGVSQELGALTEQSNAILAMLIADKFDDSHYYLKCTYIPTDNSNAMYLILNDGSKDYEMKLETGEDIFITIDGVDYTSKIFNETQIAKYYTVLSAIQLEDIVSNVTENDWNDFENITGNEAPVQGITNTNISGLSDIMTIKSNGFDAALMERKVEMYYGCEIKSIVQESEDVYDGEYENAYITMEDGSMCTYFFSDTGANIYDSTSTFETIWASWE